MTTAAPGCGPRLLATALAVCLGLSACTSASPTRTGTDSSTTAPADTSQGPTITGGTIDPQASTSGPAPTADPDGSEPEQALPLDGLVVVVDPGHNGANGAHPSEINRSVDAGGFSKACNTTGTSSNDGWPEAAFTWEVTGALTASLQAAGATVELTRDDNEGWGPCVDARGQRAAEVGADLLVSLHGDGGPPSGQGFHVIHPGELDGFTSTEDAATATELALLIRDHLVTTGLVPANYIAHEGLDERTDLGTLNRSPVPAVMIELGNMRNDDEARSMQDPAWQAKVAQAITAAIVDLRSRTHDAANVVGRVLPSKPSRLQQTPQNGCDLEARGPTVESCGKLGPDPMGTRD